MSKGRISVKRITPRVRRDGAEVEMTFSGTGNATAVVVVDRDRLRNVIEALIRIDGVLAHNEGMHRPSDPRPTEFEAPPVVFHAKDLNLVVVAESGATMLRIDTVERETLQIQMLPDHLQFLVDAIQRNGMRSSAPGTH